MIEEFIDALADLYDAKQGLNNCRIDCVIREDEELLCENYKKDFEEAKQKAEEIMRKVIRTELKVVSDDG